MVKAGRKTAAAQAGAGSRQAILEAALRTFARNGFGGASMPSIARLAGVAPPLIHYHFESKENLWREVVRFSLGELRAEAQAILRATQALAPLDRLRTLLQAHAEFAARFPDHFSMIVAEARADSDRFAWLQENYTGALFEDVVNILKEARDTGAIRAVPVEELAIVLVGGILVHFTIHPAGVREQNDTAAPARFVDFLFDLLPRANA